jgi:hypothetical protein
MCENVDYPAYSIGNILITPAVSVPHCDADTFDELFNDVLTGFEDDDLG